MMLRHIAVRRLSLALATGVWAELHTVIGRRQDEPVAGTARFPRGRWEPPDVSTWCNSRVNMFFKALAGVAGPSLATEKAGMLQHDGRQDFLHNFPEPPPFGRASMVALCEQQSWVPARGECPQIHLQELTSRLARRFHCNNSGNESALSQYGMYVMKEPAVVLSAARRGDTPCITAPTGWKCSPAGVT